MLLTLIIVNTITLWGFHAHKIINRHAIYTLPPEISTFYKQNIGYLEESSINPDIRKHSDKDEAQRHFIDLEYYGSQETFERLMAISHDSLEQIYSSDSLAQWGILPWSFKLCYQNLVYAFQDRNYDLILLYSSDIGHYVADAHVPLHTTKNYNGQLTGQHGIHSLWETQVPEKYSEDYLLFARKAVYIEDIEEMIKEIIIDSYQRSKELLKNDKSLREGFEETEIYQTDQKGNYMVKRYSSTYLKKFNQLEGENIRNQMLKAISATGSLWFSAWVDAGQPSLTSKKMGKNDTFLPKKNMLFKEREHN